MILTPTLAFYHVPKTGGTWLTEIMQAVPGWVNLGLKHATPAQEPAPGRQAFCVIRHPLDWYVSYWRFREAGRPVHPDPWFSFYGEAPHILDDVDELGSPCFETWVTRVLDRFPGFVGRLYAAYTTVDRMRVLRLEAIKHQLTALLLKHDAGAAVRALQRAPGPSSTGPKVTWSLPLWQRAVAAEARAIKRWGYK